MKVSTTLTVNGKPPIDLGSDPSLSAGAVEALLPDGKKDGSGSLMANLAARYIEGGTERRGNARYRLAYRWTGGGLFGGKSLRLKGMTRG